MRFKNFLNEAPTGEYADKILDECKPYIDDLQKQSGPSDFLAKDILGSGRKQTDLFIMSKVRKNRVPSDMPSEVHHMLDDLFEERFGVRPRSGSLFCYSDKFHAPFYGTPYGIFPIGKYKILWSPHIGDLYDALFKVSDESHLFINYLNKRESLRDKFLERTGTTFLPTYKEKKYNDDFEKFKNTIANYLDTLKEEVKGLIRTYKSIDASKLDKVSQDRELMVICDNYIGIQDKFVDDTLIDLNKRI